jgi:hypothetical protein
MGLYIMLVLMAEAAGCPLHPQMALWHCCCLPLQTSNEEAIKFYSRAGFQVGETIKHYYRRIEPPHAVVLRRVFGGILDKR